MNKLYYDAVIIGFGKGGKTLAAKLAAAGRTVALAERDSGMYGGTCINVGCIPSKSLIHSAEQTPPDPAARPDHYRAAIREKRRVTALLREKNFQKLDQQPNVTIYNGTARFTGPLAVEVDCGAEKVRLEAGQVFLNTGSTPRYPDIPGLRETPGVYTSAQLMELDELPDHLTILGGGYIGLEFASLYASFGSRVTVLQDGETFLPKEDEDIAAAIRTQLEGQGIAFRLGANTERVEPGVDGPVLTVLSGGVRETLRTSAVLVAAGRTPNTVGLDCAAAGVELTPRGAVKVDRLLRTTAPGVWAMGDVTGGRQHTYVSLDDFRVVWSQLNGGPVYSTEDRGQVPYSVFLSTPYSRVGLSEREARAAGYSVRVSVLPAAAIPKAQVLGRTGGLLKAVLDGDTGRILGCMLLCEASYETINVVKLAMDLGADYTVLRDRIFTHPTMTEALNDLFAG